ncbi:MAG: 2-succinyl-5-enolpyruvyl-6-hydroxy-3-cyclohexene-1-carboxylic-acid synthase, partial [Deltaproteobacteria bacterium]|nr:2-succinyl-5-enolpyruvyl-6-hydroxy-3-cyclohexene-1-carboxylic-acid synthase [Deltaproteobacteria bacterium]
MESLYAAIRAFVAALADAGLREVCIAPGARSTPLTLCLAGEPRLRCWSHVDERSAAFFALGLARAARRPAAVVCTSGTAAANFFPAIVEARQAHVPLLVLTADRPAELRDCGAFQAIDQIKLYGDQVKWFCEVGEASAGLAYFHALGQRAVSVAASPPGGVVHLNVPLREPLTESPLPGPPPLRGGGNAALPPRAEALPPPPRSEQAVLPPPRSEQAVPPPPHSEQAVPPPPHSEQAVLPPPRSGEAVLPPPRSGGGSGWGPQRILDASTLDDLAATLTATRRGVIVCGPLDADAESAAALRGLARRCGYPLLADATSGLRDGADDRGELVTAYDALLRDREIARRLAPELVLRVGPLPIAKSLLLWLRDGAARQIVIDPSAGWDDPLHRAERVLHADVAPLAAALAARIAAPPQASWRDAWRGAEARARAVLDAPPA